MSLTTKRRRCENTNVSAQIAMREISVHRRSRKGRLSIVPSTSSSDHFTTTLAHGRFLEASDFFQKDIKGHCGCVNAIEFSSGDQSMLASAGDDRRVTLWRVGELMTRTVPIPLAQMDKEHESNVFCLQFDPASLRIFSAGNDQKIIQHDVRTAMSLEEWNVGSTVYSLSMNPDSNHVFLAACEAGTVLQYDTRLSPNLPASVVAFNGAAYHSAYYNPIDPLIICTTNSNEGVQLWDVRRPNRSIQRYGDGLQKQKFLSAQWNSRGSSIFALRHRNSPVLFHISQTAPVALFDHISYYNGCTMKKGAFVGPEDSYVASGSDDWKVYMWKVPQLSPTDSDGGGTVLPKKVIGEATAVLRGHRSIVNQTRYSDANQLLVSSGVEKVVKLWSPWPIHNLDYDDEKLSKEPFSYPTRSAGFARNLFTHREYESMVESENPMDGPEEDTHMLAFFDVQLQQLMTRRTSAASSSSSDSSANEHEYYNDEVVSDESSDADSSSPTSPQHTSSSTADDSLSLDMRTRALSSTEQESDTEISGYLSEPLENHSDRWRRREALVHSLCLPTLQNNVLLNMTPSVRIRDVTSLVIRKRLIDSLEESRCARKRGVSDTVHGGGDGGACTTPGEDAISSAEARRRVTMAGNNKSSPLLSSALTSITAGKRRTDIATTVIREDDERRQQSSDSDSDNDDARVTVANDSTQPPSVVGRASSVDNDTPQPLTFKRRRRCAGDALRGRRHDSESE